jgi:hypothetical protein
LGALLLAFSTLHLPAKDIEPPVAVPDGTAIDPDPSNLALKKNLDRRFPALQQRFQQWNAQAAAFNARYGGRDFKDGSAEAAAGLAEQSRLSKLLKNYQREANRFKTDVGRLRPKSAGAANPSPAPSPSPAVDGAVSGDKPERDDQLALTTESEIVDAMDALGARLGWSKDKQDHLDQELRKLGYQRFPDPDQVRQTWQNILDRGPESVFARKASAGGEPGFAGAGRQTSFTDCAVFALANASGLPYGVVGARATDLIRQGEWHSGNDRKNPQQTVEHKGLNGGEVVILAETFGQAEVVPDKDFANTLKNGHPVLVNVVPSGGQGQHEVVLTKTFQFGGATWYEMMESYTGPQRRLYLSAAELKSMQKENGVAFLPEAGRTPKLLGKPAGQ